MVGVHVSDGETDHAERGLVTLRAEWRGPRAQLDHLHGQLQFNKQGPVGLEIGYAAYVRFTVYCLIFIFMCTLAICSLRICVCILYAHKVLPTSALYLY